MKQFYTFILMLLLTATSAMAQKADNTHVSVRCGDTPLESLLTDGQKQAVTHLTVTGVLLDEDYKYLRETLFGQLKELNMRDADIDTIPEGAFDVLFIINGIEKKLPLEKVYLPYGLKYIATNAFNFEVREDVAICYVTGRVPHVEIDALQRDAILQPTDNNDFIKSIGGFWYSHDESQLYYYSSTHALCSEQTLSNKLEVIHRYAFRGCTLSSDFTIPENVDSIGDEVFAYLQPIVPTGSDYCDGPRLIMAATIPPKLGKNVFANTPYETGFEPIYVQNESVDLYKSADGWKDLVIKPVSTPDKIELSSKSQYLRISINRTTMQGYSDKHIRKLICFNINGKEIMRKEINSKSFVCDIANNNGGILLVKAIYQDNTIEIIKIREAA